MTSLGKTTASFSYEDKTETTSLNGWGKAAGIVALSTKAKVDYNKTDSTSSKTVKQLILELDNATLTQAAKDVYVTTLDTYSDLINYRDWIKTNRLLIDYHLDNIGTLYNNTSGMVIYTGLSTDGTDGKLATKFFRNMLTAGGFHDDSAPKLGLGLWEPANTIVKNPHHHHWHLTLPDKKR